MVQWFPRQSIVIGVHSQVPPNGNSQDLRTLPRGGPARESEPPLRTAGDQTRKCQQENKVVGSREETNQPVVAPDGQHQQQHGQLLLPEQIGQPDQNAVSIVATAEPITHSADQSLERQVESVVMRGAAMGEEGEPPDGQSLVTSQTTTRESTIQFHLAAIEELHD